MTRDPIPASIGETVEPARRQPAPDPLRLVQRFINTHNHELESERDRLLTRKTARTWLVSHGLISPSSSVSTRELARLREIRGALRLMLAANRGGRGSAGAARLVSREGARAPLLVRFPRTGLPALEPLRPGVDGAIGRLLGIVYEATRNGSWHRLKACRQCEWAYFDRSKNRSAQWCSMSICGNRNKNRSYRRRRSGEEGA